MTYVVTLDSRFARRIVLLLVLVGIGVYFHYNPGDLEAVKTQMQKMYILP